MNLDLRILLTNEPRNQQTNMIAIIPCAGRRTRRLPDTAHTPKILLEYAEKPLIEHIVRPIDESGKFEKIVLVLSLKHGQQVIDYIRRHPFETPVKFVWQPEPLGFGHAVLQARGEVFAFHKWNPPVLIHTDDAVNTHMNLEKDLIGDITVQSVSQIGVQWRGNVRNYGMALVEDYIAPGHAPRPNAPRSRVGVERLVEKPTPLTRGEDKRERLPLSFPSYQRGWDEGGLAMTGVYYVRESRRLFRCLNKLVKTGRQLGGEFQFTHALQMMIDVGTPFQTYYHDWVDCGIIHKKEDRS